METNLWVYVSTADMINRYSYWECRIGIVGISWNIYWIKMIESGTGRGRCDDGTAAFHQRIQLGPWFTNGKSWTHPVYMGVSWWHCLFSLPRIGTHYGKSQKNLSISPFPSLVSFPFSAMAPVFGGFPQVSLWDAGGPTCCRPRRVVIMQSTCKTIQSWHSRSTSDSENGLFSSPKKLFF